MVIVKILARYSFIVKTCIYYGKNETERFNSNLYDV